jgi:hypothetical protein
MSFVIAGIVALITTVVGILNMMAVGQGDPRGDAPFPWQPFAIGYAIAGAFVASHWYHLPHLGW